MGAADEGQVLKGGADGDSERKLRHDIKNQLSNLFLAVEQLRYEIPEPSEDCLFYLDLIAKSSAKINTLLRETE
jgi:nitrogen-specific signal transduction histidine kinase